MKKIHGIVLAIIGIIAALFGIVLRLKENTAISIIGGEIQPYLLLAVQMDRLLFMLPAKSAMFR
ncbi:putative uncharacterized protein [Lachnospiraceae bacterium CAG:364]|nr:putative uncharacterized protein [Lachnospiraceae bacterium CAG:364]